ncbi:hypothetical protein ACVWXN_009152 [Bradyrhizobium sp. i1.4.4]
MPPRAIIAAAVVLPVAQASLTHWIVLGEQALPVRSELAVDDAREGQAAVAQQRVDGEADGRIRHVDDGIDTLDIEPFARDRVADIGLVLVVGIDDLDLDAFAAAVEILGGHARGLDRAHAVGVLEDARDVVEHADAHDIVGDLGARRAAHQARRQRESPFQVFHRSLPFVCRAGRRRLVLESDLPFRQSQHQPVERGRDHDLAGQPAVRQPLGGGAVEQRVFVISHRGQAREPGCVDIDVAGRTHGIATALGQDTVETMAGRGLHGAFVA